MASIPSTGEGECRGKLDFLVILWMSLKVSMAGLWVYCCWAAPGTAELIVVSSVLQGWSGSHDRQSSCPTPEQPSTHPLVPGYTRACQELDRAGTDLAVTGCPCPFLSFCDRRDMSLWHVVCGGCQVALVEGMVAPQEGSLPPPPQICLVQWVEILLTSSLDTKLQLGSPSRLETIF